MLVVCHTNSYHGFITERGDTLELECDHRRHAEVEDANRDLKYGVVFNYLPRTTSQPMPPVSQYKSWPTT